MTQAFIGIGSNIGDRIANAEGALTQLKLHPQIQIIKTSRWFHTKALCLPGETQPDFVNGVAQIETGLAPETLHRTLKEIEVQMGREPRPKKWGPRVIDLDLLFYGDQIVETPALKIPHPCAHERLFVLEPLSEIAPDFIHPIFKKAIAKLYQNMLHEASASL